jgi:hypothetical protein
MMMTCAGSALGAGIAMPLMFLVFGRLVGDFTNYFTPGSTITMEKFMNGINQNTLVYSKHMVEKIETSPYEKSNQLVNRS